MRAAVLLDGPAREAVHRLKYGDRPQLAPALASVMLEVMGGLPPGTVVPVPADPVRRRARGYDQAALLAAALARLTGRESSSGLARSRVTGTQVGRSGEERRRALRGAFTWSRPPAPTQVVLVDDVITTGSTLLECAAAVRAAGAQRIEAIALALG